MIADIGLGTPLGNALAKLTVAAAHGTQTTFTAEQAQALFDHLDRTRHVTEWLDSAGQRKTDPVRPDDPAQVAARANARLGLPTAAHLFLIDDSARLLMVRRAGTGYEDGNWSVPAGHLDGGESVTAAMVRETREEVGVVLDPGRLTVVHVMHRAPTPSNGERVDFFLAPHTWTGAPVNREPEKADMVSWWPLDGLPSNTVPYVRAALEAASRGDLYS